MRRAAEDRESAINWQQHFNILQVAQLMLTNSTTRLEVSQGHQTLLPFRMLRIVSCYCAMVTLSVRRTVLFRHLTSKWRDLETGLGLWRSLKMSPYNREPMKSYLCTIVTTALSCVVSQIFNVEKYCDLEIPVKGQSRFLKVVPFDRLCMFPNSVL